MLAIGGARTPMPVEMAEQQLASGGGWGVSDPDRSPGRWVTENPAAFTLGRDGVCAQVLAAFMHGGGGDSGLPGAGRE
jgi:hypothetical protein